MKRLQHHHKTDISKEELNELPLKAFNGEIVVINQSDRIASVFDEVKSEKVIGFDTETRPTFHKGQRHKVALIQLALPRKVFLIRLNKTGITEEILDFMAGNDTAKAGVALHDDIKALQRLSHFEPAAFVDLAVTAREAGLQVESVKKLTGLLLGFRISKSAQTSNWEANQLTDKQITYAATDAWVCLELYRKLIRQH